MTQPGLFEEMPTAPATAPRQVTRERSPGAVVQEACQKAVSAGHTKKSENVTCPPIVILDGRDYRFHRDCGEFVWLAALDAGIGGPFYWVNADELRLGPSQSVSNETRKEPEVATLAEKLSRVERLKAAQTRVASLPLNGLEYMDALGEMLALMKEGRG